MNINKESNKVKGNALKSDVKLGIEIIFIQIVCKFYWIFISDTQTSSKILRYFAGV
jgi:hypothetical protein